MKICSKCRVNKPTSEFYKTIHHKDGLRSYCKYCAKIQNEQYRLDHPNCDKQWHLDNPFESWISSTYASMKARILGKTDRAEYYKGLPILSRQEWDKWVESQYDVWFDIHNNWLITKKQKDLPSIDRIDPNQGYLVGNMRIITVSENSKLAVQKRLFMA
jgi:hypothetical protein